MNTYSIPPDNIKNVPTGTQIALVLKTLIGKKIILTPNARTNGSNLRKLVENVLSNNFSINDAKNDEYNILPAKKKGVPRLLKWCVDTYIATTGKSYNLQVWNRIPNSDSILVQYTNKNTIKSEDILYILTKVDSDTNKITSILVMTPKYIEKFFGKFGVPTIKHQLMINPSMRDKILSLKVPILSCSDTKTMQLLTTKNKLDLSKKNIKDQPEKDYIYSIDYLRDSVATRLIGINPGQEQTKNKGQALERIIAEYLGYTFNTEDLLEGGYPDFRNQLLEVKLQDSPTVDLGRYSPEFSESDFCVLPVTTRDVRYLIALTDENKKNICGIALLSGIELGKYFKYVSESSYKCQRSIPMEIFQTYNKDSIFLG